MEIPIVRNKENLLESGSYRVKLGELDHVESALGRHVFLSFDVLQEALTHRCIIVCVDAKLIAGPPPSQLYSWISALEFDGNALPQGYSLETATLLRREALAEVELIDEDGQLYNRILRLSPLRHPAAKDAEAQ